MRWPLGGRGRSYTNLSPYLSKLLRPSLRRAYIAARPPTLSGGARVLPENPDHRKQCFSRHRINLVAANPYQAGAEPGSLRAA